MSDQQLLPCPFCSTVPELPDGDGTQYAIECGECGGAAVSVQICDLMTLEERIAESFQNCRYSEKFVERAKLAAIALWNTRAPAPLIVSAEDRFEHYLQNSIDNAPEPLRRLGEYLSHVIDEDEWATAERMLNGAIVSVKGVAGLVEALEGVIKRCSRAGYVGQDGQYLKVIHAALAAHRAQQGEQS